MFACRPYKYKLNKELAGLRPSCARGLSSALAALLASHLLCPSMTALEPTALAECHGYGIFAFSLGLLDYAAESIEGGLVRIGLWLA
jgi:hypothetical protein